LAAAISYRPRSSASPIGGEVLGAPRGVELLLGFLVAGECLVVVLFGPRVRAGHLHVEVERADVVAQRDEVVAGVLAQLLGLGLLLAAEPPPVAQAEQERAAAEERQQPQGPRAARAGVVVVPLRLAAVGLRLTDEDDELVQHRGHAVIAFELERPRRQRGRDAAVEAPLRVAGPELPADDDRVDARLVERLGDLERDSARVAPGLVARSLGEDRDVERRGVRRGDPLLELALLRLRDRVLGVPVDEDRVVAQRVDRLGDRARLGAGAGRSSELRVRRDRRENMLVTERVRR
jgi:hypothetical protein